MKTKNAALATAALTLSALAVSTGAASAAVPRISGHAQLQAAVQAAAAALPGDIGIDPGLPTGIIAPPPPTGPTP